MRLKDEECVLDFFKTSDSDFEIVVVDVHKFSAFNEILEKINQNNVRTSFVLRYTGSNLS